MKPDPEPEFISVRQLTLALQVGRKQVYKWIDGGQLPGTIKIGVRLYRIPVSAFEHLKRALRIVVGPSS